MLKGVEELVKMGLHEEIATPCFYITRVVGGWLYQAERVDGYTPVFVPNPYGDVPITEHHIKVGGSK